MKLKTQTASIFVDVILPSLSSLSADRKAVDADDKRREEESDEGNYAAK